MPEEGKLSRLQLTNQLSETIQALNKIVTRLEQDQTASLPPDWPPELVTTLLSTSQQMLDSSQALPPPAEPEEFGPEELQGLDHFLPSFNRWQRGWQSVLGTIRRLLPAPIRGQISDWGLTAILVVLIVSGLLASVLFLSRPVSDVGPASRTPTDLEPRSPASELILPSPAPIQSEPDNPPVLEAPAEPEVVELAPPEEAALTPEQSLLGIIRQELFDLTQSYSPSLVVLIQPNFDTSHLTLTLGPAWDELSPQRQATWVKQVWQKTQKLSFRKLTILGPKGQLLARSPVVGQEMLIFRTEESSRQSGEP
ncbi:hypothetical protein [Synechocystis sp. LKSZ1]|uniref:hypothetical protein n=1 Tax=Synechocystis sp. LKSZ1 TaxID=3144951 RepID=UPI00336BDE0D